MADIIRSLAKGLDSRLSGFYTTTIEKTNLAGETIRSETVIKTDSVRKKEAWIFNISTALIGCVAIRILTRSFRVSALNGIFFVASLLSRWISEEALFLSIKDKTDSTVKTPFKALKENEGLVPDLPTYRPWTVGRHILFLTPPMY